VDYDKSLNQPKAVLGDLSTQFFEKFKKIDATSAVFLLSELQTALTQKEIQVFFADKQLQKHFQDFGWTGEITPGLVNQDYLLVVNANLNGQKSDAKIQQQIEHQAVIQADGTVVDTVIIERTHNGLPGEAFYGANNVSYIRIYVPEGAELLSAGGFSFPPEDAFHVPEAWYKNDADLAQLEQEVTIDKQTGTHITKEFNKTAFGNWTMVAPGQTTKVYFTYRLPFKLLVNQSEYNNQDSLLAEVWRPLSKFLVGKNREVSKYSLAVQKQSGSNSNFSTRIIYPEGWTPLWQANEKMNLAVNGGEYGGELLDDELFGLVMEKK
jgi:hypothetical protein